MLKVRLTRRMIALLTALAQILGLTAVVALAGHPVFGPPSAGLSRMLRALARRLRRLARRRVLCIVAAGLAPVAIRLAVLPVMPPPQPVVQDEFAYLLGADTFASGRLVNPSHPLREYFETFHVLMEPTYVSKYLPAQSAVLGLGQAIFGHPWAGVLIGVALMGSAISWMLYGWLPPRFALLGTLLAAAHFSMFNYWVNSYWGGAIPAAAGALVLGAYPRLRKNARVLDSLLLGVGFGTLALSRAYEGLALSVPVAVALGVWAWRTRRIRWVAPCAAVVIATLSFLAYYNHRATGHPARLPYRVHEMKYGVAPLFLFGGLRPVPEYTEARFRQFWAEWDVSVYEGVRSDLAEFLIWKVIPGAMFYVRGWPQILSVLLIPALLLWRRARFPLMVTAFFVAALTIEKAVLAHYASPGASLMILVSVLSLFALSRWRPEGRPIGSLMAKVVVAGWILVVPWRLLVPSDPPPDLFRGFRQKRPDVLRRLDQQPGKHLVLVRYAADHNFHHEWIYNRADIDGARIVWARGFGGDRDRRLLEYYADRTVWELDPDLPGAPLRAYGSRERAGR